jgi:hypothetical protein
MPDAEAHQFKMGEVRSLFERVKKEKKKQDIITLIHLILSN